MLNRLLLSTTLAILILTTGCSDTQNSESKTDTQKANALVSETIYKLEDTNGKVYSVKKELDGFKLLHNDKIVIYDIFATWCPPCRAEATYLSNLQKKYQDDIIILGISIEKGIDTAALKTFSSTYNATYPLSVSKDNSKLARAIAHAIKAGPQFPIPMMVIYVNGKYQTHYVGATPQEMIESDIKLIIKAQEGDK